MNLGRRNNFRSSTAFSKMKFSKRGKSTLEMSMKFEAEFMSDIPHNGKTYVAYMSC